jgi:hypothetical protein
LDGFICTEAMVDPRSIYRQLAMADVGMLIDGAVGSRTAIDAHQEAELICKRHPDSGMTVDEVAMEIIRLAADRGVAARL